MLSPSLMLNAAVVRRPLPTFPVVVRCPILLAVIVRCHCPPPSSAAIAVVFCRRCLPLPPSSPQPSSPLCRLHCLSPPALILPRHSLPPDLASRCHLPPSSSATVVVRCCHQCLPARSATVASIIATQLSPRLLPPLSLPHSSTPPDLACLHCPPPTVAAAVVSSAAPFS